MVAASRITPGKKASGSKDIELSQLISERIWTRSLLRFPKGKQEKILNNIGKISVNTNNTKTYTMGQNIYINTLKCSGYDHAHTIFHDGVSNYQPHHCLLNRLFGRRSRKASKLRVTGLCAGNSPGPVNSPHKGPVTRKMVTVDDPIMAWHSVESPSMVDPQWNIWYWGSKWNLHTVCRSAVGCEWGTTSVYFGITYVCFIPSRLPVFAVEPQYLLQYFYFCQKYHLNYTYKIFKKFHVGLKFEWGL